MYNAARCQLQNLQKFGHFCIWQSHQGGDYHYIWQESLREYICFNPKAIILKYNAARLKFQTLQKFCHFCIWQSHPKDDYQYIGQDTLKYIFVCNPKNH
jgi:hypothetical protein